MSIDFPVGTDIDAELQKLEAQCQESKRAHEESIEPFKRKFEENRYMFR